MIEAMEDKQMLLRMLDLCKVFQHSLLSTSLSQTAGVWYIEAWLKHFLTDRSQQVITDPYE